MDLRCKIGHLFASTVDVDGVGVEVGPEGIARNVPDEAAATLLLNKTGWAKHVEEQPPKAPAAPPTEKQDEPSETADAPASSAKTPKKRSTSTPKKRRGVADVLGLGGKDKD